MLPIRGERERESNSSSGKVITSLFEELYSQAQNADRKKHEAIF